MSLYTESEREQAKTPEADDWFVKIAHGNADALRFMRVLWAWEHALDDLWDRDQPITQDQVAATWLDLIRELSFNPFYTGNAAYLFGLLTQMFNRWVDGDEWEASDDPDQRLAARFVRCGDIDLYLSVAYLTGGYDHMRDCKGARAYDHGGQHGPV